MTFEMTSFVEIAILLVMAASVGIVGTLLRHPPVVSLIAFGLIAGASALDVVHSDEQIDLLSKLGFAVLLYLVGVKLGSKLARTSGFSGRIAAASHGAAETEVLFGSGAELVLAPFQAAADRAVWRSRSRTHRDPGDFHQKTHDRLTIISQIPTPRRLL